MPCDSGLLWEHVADTTTFRRVSAPLMAFRCSDPGGFPERWLAGRTYRLSMYLFGRIPLGWHEIAVLAIDHTGRRFSTAEQGLLIRGWRHTMHVRTGGRGETVFRDELDVRSGIVTPLIMAGAYLFFRYRHWRLRRLISDGKLIANN